MSVKTYKCPICGRFYTSPIAMAQCTTKCAEIEAKEQDRKEKELKSKALIEKEKEVYTAYDVLKNKIRDYNSLGGNKTFTSTLRGSNENTSFKFEDADGNEWTASVETFNLPKDFDVMVYPDSRTEVSRKPNFEEWLKDNVGIEEPKAPKAPKAPKTTQKSLADLDKELNEELEKLAKESPFCAALATVLLDAITSMEDVT